MVYALQIHIFVTCYIHLYIHHTKRSPYLFHSSVTTLILPENQRQSTSFSMNAANLFLSTTAPNKLIDSKHYGSEGKY